VQVRALSSVAVELHWDIVAAACQVFGVQGLVDVADEVQDEFEGFVAGAEGVGGVEEEGGLLLLSMLIWSCYTLALVLGVYA